MQATASTPCTPKAPKSDSEQSDPGRLPGQDQQVSLNTAVMIRYLFLYMDMCLVAVNFTTHEKLQALAAPRSNKLVHKELIRKQTMARFSFIQLLPAGHVYIVHQYERAWGE